MSRELLLGLFEAAVAAADPAGLLAGRLPAPPKGRTLVVGAGKAAAGMARAVEREWEGRLEGLVVVPYGSAAAGERIMVVEAAHPVPDAAGLEAAARILRLAAGLGGGRPDALPRLGRTDPRCSSSPRTVSPWRTCESSPRRYCGPAPPSPR